MLVLDIGNTNLKWGRVENGAVLTHGAAMHRGPGVAAALDAAGLPAGAESEGVAVVNVAGPGAEDAVRRRFKTPPRILAASAAACGVVNGYVDPQRLGVDRWAALVAARRLGGACVVVGCGTALTVDALDPDGRHLGGYIVPGLVAMRDALLARAHGIVAVGGDEGTALGRDTASATAAGINRAAAALAEAALADCEHARPGAWNLILTGGDAGRVARGLARPHRIEPHLVLIGGAQLAEHAAQ